jgi:hypothetical protein
LRVTSDFWVSALVRRIFNAGGFAAIGRRGAKEAGAIFILVRSRDGRFRLLGPAAQSSYDEAGPQERRFGQLLEGEDEALLDARLAKEGRFDPDFWLVEIEADDGLIAEVVPITTP